MCGIVGVLRLSERPLPDVAVARAMARSILHRGPDGLGTFADDDVLLGAVRLAVVDPEGGAQPAFGCTSGVVAVYNGETYNHRALRAPLESAGHALRDRCDTSLVPHLWEKRGRAFVDDLHGMFALAVWDARARTLLLARDRLGIKPLVYAVTRDVLVFASEAKAIFASGLVDPAIDRDALDDVFSLGYPCPPRTMFAGVRALPPGHTLLVPARAPPPSPERYWRAPIPVVGAHRRGSFDALAGEVREVLGAAVKSHLVADVPVGACVSGGLDSSTIAALASVSGDDDAVRTWALRFEDAPALDESGYARDVAAYLGCAHRDVSIGHDAATLLPEMIWHMEQPLMVPGAIGGLLLARALRDSGVKVTLTGDGADELLGGYDVFRVARLRHLLDRPGLRGAAPSFISLAARAAGQPRGLAALLADTTRRSATIARGFGGALPPWTDAWRLLDIDDAHGRAALLGVGGRLARPTLVAPTPWAQLVRDDISALDPLDAAISIELETRLPGWILPISDRSFMSHGVEARVPFLDDAVVEHLLALPPGFKMRVLEEKAILRRAARDLLPRTITRRRKQPFVTPVAPWFFTERAPALVEEHLDPRAVEGAGVFAPEVVRHMRAALPRAPAGSAAQRALELTLMLVLGTQILAAQIVRGTHRPGARFDDPPTT